MAALLMIVSRDQHVLYARLREEFAGDTALTVMVDRRFGERRRDGRPVARDQRRADRRRHDIDEALRTLGYALVRLG